MSVGVPVENRAHVYFWGMGIGDGHMAKRQQPWWWRSEALGQVAVTLFAAVVAAYLARLLMLYFP